LAGALGGGLAIVQLVLRHAGRPGSARALRAGEDGGEVRRYLAECAATGVGTEGRVARMAEGLGLLLAEAAPLSQVQLALADDPASSLDPRVRTWLAVNRAPIAAAHLDELRLGGLRQPVEAFVRGLGADLVLPLVHRGRLVGVASARGPARRVLRGRSAGAVQVIHDAAGAVLGEVLLRGQLDQRAEMTREVAAAASVGREQEAGTSEDVLAGCRVIRFYAPARQFSGTWWTAHELSDGRLFVALGEVTARGVPAALLSATAIGACEAAKQGLGSGVEITALLELLHNSVSAAGRGAYSMSCVVAIIDADEGVVAFTCAGHPFPYLCRPWMGHNKRGALRAMVSRGTQLGGVDPPMKSVSTLAITPSDVLVFFSSSLIDARNSEGSSFGDRRLQHIVRHASVTGATEPDGLRLADRIGDDVLAHIGDRPLDDDVLVATVEVRL
jgi:serine phosphatase RsbU (regulator of sigma subunit)